MHVRLFASSFSRLFIFHFFIIHSFIHSSTHPFIHLFIRSFINIFVHSIQSFIDSFIQLFIFSSVFCFNCLFAFFCLYNLFVLFIASTFNRKNRRNGMRWRRFSGLASWHWSRFRRRKRYSTTGKPINQPSDVQPKHSSSANAICVSCWYC